MAINANVKELSLQTCPEACAPLENILQRQTGIYVAYT